ncbi:hypothetical protein [Cryobacterium aureum]|uniref:hypothetical protein n=1 Tax=Cryobacterium aureum TaxID=995037 RepID=UPI000CF37D74|nr:hypothetical protein [Cryobacterium aureum]
MGELLFDFGDGGGPDVVGEPLPKSMTDSQRRLIRDAFDLLGLKNAQEQFAVVEELTGVHIRSVHDLQESTARTLLHFLGSRVKNAHKKNTGDTWADRDEDTWIDKL